MDDVSVPVETSSPREFISWWADRILSARKFHGKSFKRMRANSVFARGLQWENQAEDASNGKRDDRYIVNVVQSEIAASVAALYAKNPTFMVKRKPRMDFRIWDEDPKSYEEAQRAVMEATQMAAQKPPVAVPGPDGLPVLMPAQPQIPPDAMALIADVNEGMARRKTLDRVGKTLELLFAQQLLQQQPSFKREMKQLVRRIETTGIGYIKLGFQRVSEVSPEESLRVGDIASRMATLENLARKVADPEGSPERVEEELRIANETLQQTSAVVTREGLTINFPRSTAIIIDPACTQISGFVGARWIAEEFNLTKDKIQEIYKKDVCSSGAHAYVRNRISGTDDEWSPNKRRAAGENIDYDDTFRVWEVYNIDTNSVFTICEGFDEYLRDPANPDVLLEQFFPYYPVSFYDVEDETSIYPPSMVDMIFHQQCELNRQKESLRQHRINSKPQYASVTGAMGEEDRKNMEGAPAFAVIELNSLEPGQSVDSLLQQIKKHPIDMNIYSSSDVLDDMRRVTRRSEARVGGVSKMSATADSIAEDSRQGEDRSKADDIDDLLSAFARDAGNVLMMNMSKDQVVRLVGPGAAWPEADPSDLLDDIYLDVRAGSSGKPNQALEVATFQRLFPVLVQTPGIRPDWLARTAIRMADSTIDFTEAYLDGLPSIQAMNSMMQKSLSPQPGTGDPATDPQTQGDEGSDKNPRPPGADQSLTINPGMNDIPDTGGGSILM